MRKYTGDWIAICIQVIPSSMWHTGMATPEVFSSLGKQSYNKGDMNKARIYLEDAYHKMPNSLDYATNLAKAYYTPREYKKIIQILSAFPESSNPSYEIHLFLGKSHQALGEYDNDVEIYNKAISHFGIDVNLLNPMEECYNRFGSMDEALAVNPDQPQIKKIIKNIKE